MESLRVFAGELYRLLLSRTAWVAGLFLVLVPALRVFATHVGQQAERARLVASGRQLPEGEMSGTGWGPFVDGWRAGLALGAFLLLIHAARALAADRESWVLRLAATRRAPRVSLVLGRALLSPLLVLAVASLSGLGAWLTAGQFFDFGPLVEDGYEILSAHELRSELVPSALAALPALVALYAFGLLVSALAGNAATAVSLSLAAFLTFDLFKEVLGRAQYWVFAAFTPSFLDSSAMSEMSGIARGFSDAGYDAGLMRMNLWLPWPEALVAIVLACWVMSRRTL